MEFSSRVLRDLVTASAGGSRDLLISLLDSAELAAFVVEHGSRKIGGVNPAVEEMFGYSPEELLGRSTRVLHADEQSYLRFGEKSTPLVERGRPFHDSYWMRRRDGSLFPSRHTVTPAHHFGGRILVVSLVRDLTRDTDDRTRKALTRLTPREREIFDLASRGWTSREIAESLKISPRTVEHHRRAILNKFHVNSMAELLAKLYTPRRLDRETPGDAPEE